MKYILQVNTGNLDTPNYRADEISERLDHILEYLDVSRVIFGWHDDHEENEKICRYLKKKGIEAYFWLPVFAEIIDMDKEDSYVETDLFEKKESRLNNGDAFEFVCQSSEKNIRYITDRFEEICADIDLDGVFLDRIRYKSPALARDAIFGCQCQSCRKMYYENVIDKGIYDKLIPQRIENGVYRYDDGMIDDLMRIKRETINRQIERLHGYFKGRGLKVGLDTFALCLADFVGQDIISLNDFSDFIKPMFYLRTTAPAGLPFELDGLPERTRNRINELWEKDVNTIEGSVMQCEYLLNHGVRIAPGIDVNHIEGICDSNEEYVLEYIENLKKIGCEEIVLSWDSMKLEDSLLEKMTIKQ